MSFKVWGIRLLLIGMVVAAVAGYLIYRVDRSAYAEILVEVDKLPVHSVDRGDLSVTVIEQGGLESSENTEVKCLVRGQNTVNWVIENGTYVEKGDVLVQLDTLAIEDAINERSKYAFWSQSGAERSSATVARAKLAISEYKDGRFISDLMTLEKELAFARSNKKTSESRYRHTEKMKSRGFANILEVEQKKVDFEQAKLEVEAKEKQIEVLKKYTKAMELKTLEGDLKAAEATHAANQERAVLDAKRRDLAKAEFELCVIKAEKSGMVIFPSAAAWKASPDITEGATVHKDQVMLLMPDLQKMQVKVAIHESVVDRVKLGMKAKVSIPDSVIEGEVISIASVATPAGWWTGNMVKYDTIVRLPEGTPGLKPGMSAEVEIVLSQYKDVLKLPVSAVLEIDQESLCWVKTANSIERRVVEVVESNEVFVVIDRGVDVGDEVVLDPIAFVREAQVEAMKSVDAELENAVSEIAPPESLTDE